MTLAGLEALFRSLPEPHLGLDASGRILAVSPGAIRVLGLEPAAARGTSLADLETGDGGRTREFLQRCLRSTSMIPGRIAIGGTGASPREVACRGAAVRGENEERLILLRLDPDADSTSGFLALTRTVEALQREAADRRIAEIELRRSQERAMLLAEASGVLGSFLAIEVALGKVVKLAVPTFADWAAIDLETPAGVMERVATEPSLPRTVTMVEDFQRLSSDVAARGGPGQISRSGDPEWIRGTHAAFPARHQGPDGGAPGLTGAPDPRSYIRAPLRTSEGVLGSLILVRAGAGEPYNDGDVRFAEDLALRVATAIENARLVRELETAHEQIQGQATELEAQTEQLQAQAAHLEDHAVELEEQVKEARLLNDALAQTNTRLAEASQAAHSARQEAERANAAKSQFLTVMSHELRTPMNAIMGYTDLLDAEIAGQLNADQKRQLDRIRVGSRHLLDLINQILGLARIEAGREEVSFAEIDVSAVIGEVVAMMETLALRKHIEIRSILPERCVVVSDGTKIRQIVVNLLNNAIKFTHAGFVEVSARCSAGQLEVRVRDTGVGIAPGNHERIFVAFEQLDRDLRTPTQGTGLGLSVSRELARLMGGDLVVESTLGAGSTFTLSLEL